MYRLVVIGDVHANAVSLASALLAIESYCELHQVAIDKLIFVGDLLTYGVDISTTFELICKASNSFDTCFILGNHDQLYLDLIRQDTSRYYCKLPDWIMESVDFTLSRMNHLLFASIPFEQSFSYSQIFFSHANSSLLASTDPNWSYVNSYEEHDVELSRLACHSYNVGIFGHTHRRRLFYREESDSAGCFLDLVSNRSMSIDVARGQSAVINVGSIGQPRSPQDLAPSLLLLEYAKSKQIDKLKVSFIPYYYDFNDHVASVNDSTLSESTKLKLVSYFRS